MALAAPIQKNFRAARLQRQFTQQALADRSGLSLSYISMLERGQRSPPLDTLEALAGALGVPAGQLLR